MTIPISSYKPFTSQKDGLVKPGGIPFDSEFFTEIERIKSGYYKDVVYNIRAIEDKKERQLFKAQNLPALTISCTCQQWRKEENVVAHTGLMVIDIDDEKNTEINDWKKYRDSLFELDFVLCAFLSASERGVAFIIKIVPALHLETFRFIEWELKTKNNITVDKSGKDVVRLRFVSFDPDLRLKENFDAVPVVMPSDEYFENKNKGFKPDKIKFSSHADSYITFSHAVERANRTDFFEPGTKHNHIIRVASYCNHVGMSEDFCLSMFSSKYQEDGTPWDHIKDRVKSIYTTYKAQHKSKELPKPPYTTKELKWLLKYVSKSLLKQHIYEYGAEGYPGEEQYTIQVSTKLLCFLMHLISPTYTWTTHEADESFSNEDCKDTIPDNAYLDSCNGSRVWCSNEFKYPINWD